MSWRKPPRLGKGDIICTRLILPAVFPAVKKTRNSEGFCEDNLPLQMSEQNSQGRGRPTMLTVPIHAPPGQSDNPYLLTKINGNCYSNTRSRQSQMQTYNSNKKRMLLIQAESSDRLLGSVLVHFQQDLE